MAQQGADLVERVVLVAAVSQGVLLDAAADLVEDLGAELDDVERVQHRDRVWQLVADGVGIPAERVQRGVLHGRGEPLGLGGQPPRVGGPRPARDHVQQPGTHASVLVTSQIDHAGHGPVPAVVRGLPDVLIDAQRHHSAQPAGVCQPPHGFDLDRVPGRVPVHPKVAGQRRDRGVVMGQRVGGPPDRPGRELGPRLDQRVGLGEHPDRASGVRAAPDPLAPGDHDRAPERRGVVRAVDPPPVADRDHPAGPAAGRELIGLDRHHQPAAGVVAHVDHVQAGGIEHLISAGAPGRTDAASTLRHVGVSGRTVAWSLPILEAPTPTSPDRHAPTPQQAHPRSDPKSP